ncbi:MAG TPA: DUF2634 domain-containing protein [Ruminiclostridium sp.]|nr:DUF2634 domain-containing protein [Ruminiclostridium sp.]
MSLFPFIGQQDDSSGGTAAALPREYAWDFENNDFIYDNGKPKMTEGLEAVRIWACKALSTQRYRYLSYTWDYGHEIENLIGNNLSVDFIQSEIKRYIEEAFSVNPFIKGINGLTATLNDCRIQVSFTLMTDFGEVDISV